jgi:hypothetical protein
MEHRIEIQNKGDYLLVDYTGDFTLEGAKECIDRFVDACEEQKCTKVVLDTRKMTGRLGIMDRYKMGRYAIKTKFLKIRTAMIGTKIYVLPDRFLENVATNLGVDVKVFLDPDEALEWLRS